MYISKKTLLTVVSVILVLSLAIGGTLADLQDKSEPVVNEFQKHKVVVDLTETGTDANGVNNSYSIVPGTEAGKDPMVTVTATLDSWAFLQVQDNTEDLVSFEINDTIWSALPGYTGVYYKEIQGSTEAQSFYTLKGNDTYPHGVVTYSADITNETMNYDGTNPVNITFTAYAIQKTGFDEAVKAWIYCSTGVMASSVTQVPATATGKQQTQAIAEAVANADGKDVAVVLAASEDPIVLPIGLADGNVAIVGQGADETIIDIANYSTTGNGNGSNSNLSIVITDATIVASDSEDTYWENVSNAELKNTTFKNCVIDARDSNFSNAFYRGTVTGNVTFEDCTIYADVYAINFNYVNGILTLRNCDITGWNSFGGATAGNTSKVIVEGCTFHKSGSYGVLRFYQDAKVSNCTFDDNFDGLDINASNVTITIDNCTGLGKPGDANYKIFDNNGNHTGYKFIIDGVEYTSVQAW